MAITARLLITPSLLNSWLYIQECRKYVRESEEDIMCIEDKRDLASEKALEEFLKYLRREPQEPSPAILKGIAFEEETLKGNTPASQIVKGGAYQLTGQAKIYVNGQAYLMYGRLDWIKGGVIYDTKRVSRYEYPKYAKSYQHGFYFDLWQEAKEFDYLIYDDNEKLHIEKYYRDDCANKTKEVIANFAKWLKQNNYWQIYFQNWKAKRKEN